MAQSPETDSLPKTTLIIPTRNRPQMFKETVASVLSGEEVPTEIVIIDQSTVPDTTFPPIKTERECDIRYFHVRTSGLSRARNEGIQNARYEILAFLDDDMYVAQDWYGSLIRALLKAGPGSAVTGRVLPFQERNGKGFVPSLAISEEPCQYRGRQATDMLAGGHMVTTRSVFNQVGCFDERLGAGTKFPSSEDNDWGFRLLEAGGTIVYAPEAAVYHRAWRVPRDYYSMRWNYGHGQGGFYAKYLSLQDKHMLKRLIKDARFRLRGLPIRCFQNPHGVVGDAIFILALFTGTMKWLITYPNLKELSLCQTKEVNA